MSIFFFDFAFLNDYTSFNDKGKEKEKESDKNKNNIELIETKKINSSLKKPLAIVNNNDDNAPEKFIIEEQIKRPIEKEKKIDEMIEKELENKFDSNDLKNKQI